MTSSGLVGRVENVKDRYISIKLNENVSINMQKEFVSSKLPKGTINSIEAQWINLKFGRLDWFIQF